jgi:phage-related protein
MKNIHWMGSSYTDLCRFPESVLKQAGYQLHLVQSGFYPTDWKPMPNIGRSVCEIRLHEDGEYRIIYLSGVGLYLTCFPKKDTEDAKTGCRLG